MRIRQANEENNKITYQASFIMSVILGYLEFYHLMSIPELMRHINNCDKFLKSFSGYREQLLPEKLKCISQIYTTLLKMQIALEEDEALKKTEQRNYITFHLPPDEFIKLFDLACIGEDYRSYMQFLKHAQSEMTRSYSEREVTFNPKFIYTHPIDLSVGIIFSLIGLVVALIVESFTKEHRNTYLATALMLSLFICSFLNKLIEKNELKTNLITLNNSILSMENLMGLGNLEKLTSIGYPHKALNVNRVCIKNFGVFSEGKEVAKVKKPLGFMSNARSPKL